MATVAIAIGMCGSVGGIGKPVVVGSRVTVGLGRVVRVTGLVLMC